MSVTGDDMNSLTGGLGGVDISALNAVTPGLTGGGGILSGLGSALGGILENPLLDLTGSYELANSQMNKTQKANDQLAGSLEQIGEPFYQAGTSELGAYESGQLTGPFSTQANTAIATNAQAATSQEQQVAQMLAGSAGGQNIEGAQASMTQSIQGRQNLANQQAIAQAFLQELNSATGLGSEGGNYISQGIQSEIQSNTQLSGQMQQMMAAMAQAYSQQGGGGFSGLFSGISSLFSFL